MFWMCVRRLLSVYEFSINDSIRSSSNSEAIDSQALSCPSRAVVLNQIFVPMWGDVVDNILYIVMPQVCVNRFVM